MQKTLPSASFTSASATSVESGNTSPVVVVVGSSASSAQSRQAASQSGRRWDCHNLLSSTRSPEELTGTSDVLYEAAAVAASTSSTTSGSGGYDVELVTQLSDADRARYVCPICLLLMRDPVQTIHCGHRFCQLCIRRWCRTNSKCPMCKFSLSSDDRSGLFLDLGTKREILDLSVFCVNSKTGCNRGQLSLGELLVHLSACPGAKQLCELCGERILKSEVLQHQNSECMSVVVECCFRPFGCKHQCERRYAEHHLANAVQEHLSHVADHLLNHLQTCAGSSVADSVLVTALHQRQQQQQLHPSGRPSSSPSPPPPPGHRMCFGEPVKTPGYAGGVHDAMLHVPVSNLQGLGGQSTVVTAAPPSPRPGSTAAQTYFTDERLAEMVRNLQKFGKPSASSTSSSSVLQEYRSSSTPTLPSTVDSGFVSSKLYGAYSGNFSVPPSSAAEQSWQQLQAEQPEIANQLLRFSNLEVRVNELEARVSDLEADSGCRNGVFVMKLDSFTQRRLVEARDGKMAVIYSRSFYSHPQGYKFCLRVHPNGVAQSPTGNSQSSAGAGFLSLFIHLMRGDYDDILDWPFRGRIVLSILDVSRPPSTSGSVQSTTGSVVGRPAAAAKRKDISAVVEETDQSLEAFTRPQSTRNRRGFGYTEFASLDELLGAGNDGGGGVPSSRYLVNDTLYIRATMQSLT